VFFHEAIAVRHPCLTLNLRMRCVSSHQRSGFDQLSYAHHCQNNCRTIDNLGAPDRTRTCNRRLRRPMLYPVELRARARSLAHRSCLDSSLRLVPIEVVGVEGFELSTSSSQSWRSTRLSYTPPTPAYSCRTAAESARRASGHRGSLASINTSFFAPPPVAWQRHFKIKRVPKHPSPIWRARRDSNSRPPSS
jgi:hypothetical protein